MQDESIFEDLEILQIARRGGRKTKTYKKRIDYLQVYNDDDFKKNYRMDKETVIYITDLIQNKLKFASNRGCPVPPLTMVLITLRYLAKGSYQLDCADLHGVSQKTVSTIVKKVVHALAEKLPEFVKFPETSNDIKNIKAGFLEKFGFPQCLGAIDCTQIKIKNPGGELGGRHRCRKGFYALNVQMVVDYKCKILDVVARWRGSTHDSRIFNHSSIKNRLQNMDRRGGVLLGDGGYKQSHIMMTPFRLGAVLTPAEQIYQRHHILGRGVVERTFGQIKNCFRCCFNGLQTDLDTAKNMVVAIAVLWNIAHERKQSLIEDSDAMEAEEPNDEVDNSEEVRGTEFRRNFINTYFT